MGGTSTRRVWNGNGTIIARIPCEVALAEDGALFREGLVMLLQAAGHEIVGCTADGDSLVELLSSQTADVTILDIRMPPEPDGGLLTAGRLRAMQPDMGLLFLSHYAESHYLMRILQVGTEAIGSRLTGEGGQRRRALPTSWTGIRRRRSSSS
jgi:CheY-like chemotaxis protein